MSILGTRVKRVEDPALLQGHGRYGDDLHIDGALHAVFVRSMQPHGIIEDIDLSEASTMPGVVAVLTADDLGLADQPPPFPMLSSDMSRCLLARERVRFAGEPIAMVVARSYVDAVDAAEMVFVDIDPLPAVVDPHDSLTSKTLLFPAAGTNVAFAVPGSDDETFFEGCEVVVEQTFRNQRVSGCPIEPRSTTAKWSDENGRLRLTQWSCTQYPHQTRDALAAACGVEPADVRVITPEVGGGFGAKTGRYPEDVAVALAARKLERPITWTETRSESMLNLQHGRGQEITSTVGGTRDGDIQAYRLRILQDAGAHPMGGALLPTFSQMMQTAVYDIPAVDFGFTSVVTNTTPVAAYRGAGRPEAAHAIERIIDVFAAEIGLDPAEVRRRNFVQPDAFPFTTPSGVTMDSGRYEDALDAVLAHLDLDALREEQQRRRSAGSEPLLGIGWAAFVEIANPLGAPEFGSVQVRTDGSALVLTGSSAHGQGHHTTFAQIAADELGIPFDRIEVRHGDTDEVKRGGGTGGSRSVQVGGSAVRQAGEALVERARELAADHLEANVDDVILDHERGTFSVVGTPAVSVGWSDLAGQVEADGGALLAEADFDGGNTTFPFGVHASVVEVDRDTGAVKILRHVACDDSGVIINPELADGQVHGGIAAGISQALLEEVRYDPDGNPITSNLADYGLISAAELPSFERIEQQTPTPLNPLGAKGIGESGTIGAIPAVQNAVVDALAHLGVRHVDIPVTAERVWRAITAAD